MLSDMQVSRRSVACGDFVVARQGGAVVLVEESYKENKANVGRVVWMRMRWVENIPMAMFS